MAIKQERPKITCNVLVQQNKGGFVANVLGLPGCVFEASTRDGAIEQARDEVRRMLVEGEIVRVKVDGPPELENCHIGIFPNVDDETWSSFIQTLREYGRQVDANQF